MQDLIHAVQVTINYRSPLAAGHAPFPTLHVIDRLKWLRVACYYSHNQEYMSTKNSQSLIDHSHELFR